MKPYPKYRDSGIKWIQKIPEGWSILRLKYFMKINPSKSSTVLNENISGEVSFLPMEKVDSDGKYDVASMKSIDEVNNGFTCFKINDVIFAKITPCFENEKGALLDRIKTNIGFGSTEFHVLRSIKNMSDPKYLYYITKTHPFRKMGEAFMSGSAGQKRVPSHFIENLFFPYSALPEQEQIAKYLDHKTEKIDSLIEKKKRLIELLKEERTAVINQAVTKGLDPNLPMKDSGIEWLGEIPVHWEVKKLKYLCNTTKGFAFKTILFSLTGISVVKASDIKNDTIDKVTDYLSDEDAMNYENVKLRINDIIISTVGSRPEVLNSAVGQIGIVPSLFDGAYLNQNTVRFEIKDNNQVFYLFLFFTLKSNPYRKYLNLHAHGTANQASLNIIDMLEYFIGLPNIEEQKEIAVYIEKETNRIDTIISKSEKEIELLQEYRTALISEVVTGKIDIRKEKI